jgi:15-cis-phytoene synthase
MADVFSHCEQLVREADKDRFLATLFAPAADRPPLFALYAFNVELARIGELVSGPMPGEIRLQWWREVLEGQRDEEAAAHPIAQALLETKRHHGLPLEQFEEAIEGRLTELYDDPFSTLHDIENHAARIGATPILLAARILAAGRDPQIDSLAGHAGIAHALTGLLRAFPYRVARGKVDLPTELLQRHRVDREEIVARQVSNGLRAALAELRARAREHLDAARPLAAQASPALMAALLPAALVPQWLSRLHDSEPFAPVEIPQWRRQWILWRAARRGLARSL